MDRPDCAAVVQTRHWIVDNDDLVRQVGIQFERSEEEGERERGPVPSAQRVAEAGFSRAGFLEAKGTFFCRISSW